MGVSNFERVFQKVDDYQVQSVMLVDGLDIFWLRFVKYGYISLYEPKVFMWQSLGVGVGGRL